MSHPKTMTVHLAASGLPEVMAAIADLAERCERAETDADRLAKELVLMADRAREAVPAAIGLHAEAVVARG
jgi:hypothetical protein